MSRRPVLIAAALVAIAVLVWWPRAGRNGQGSGSAGSGRVTRVVDGDTIHVRLGRRDETVRYIGMDTPESVKPGTPVQCFAKKASSANASMVAGRRVRLSYDAERRDRYGRLLAYVYRADDGAFVNAELVREGYAQTLTIPPNIRFAERLAGLQRQARSAGVGLWSACR